MRKIYLLIYSDATGSRDVIKSWAEVEEKVLHWRYDLPNSFYLISYDSAKDLANSLMKFTNKKGRFLITEISDNRQGLLPRETWQLMREKKR